MGVRALTALLFCLQGEAGKPGPIGETGDIGDIGQEGGMGLKGARGTIGPVVSAQLSILRVLTPPNFLCVQYV